jgi:PQQ-dependent dehydrogenase (methanol/ethanol family)
LTVLTAACTEPSSDIAVAVNESRILAAEDDTANWLSHGRTYAEQRYVPLSNINPGNIDRLGLAWHFDFPTRRGIESTPLIIDGVMFVTSSWSMVFALDARTGRQIWSYDPQVPRIWAKNACCDAVNRGVAAWGDKVFVGTLDGYLVALERSTGAVVWRVNTIDREQPYTITGAPRVIKGKVIIGNGGAEFGVRGYVSAFDAETGEQVWRFYTVPGNPDDGFENEAMAEAAETWSGEWWKLGGGGTVWDSMAYDPDADLLYIGVGNGSPWNRNIRSPGGGDNLFVSSIVALRPDSGDYVWHYQTTPGDSWDYTATQSIILADLVIDGETRKILMQAPKNGFFYVLDRLTGEFISAEKFAAVNWASHIDKATGRPVEVDNADYNKGPRLAWPAPFGAHNWHPMSYNPNTGLVYVPAQEVPWLYANDEEFGFIKGQWNTGTDALLGDLPTDPLQIAQLSANMRGFLLAWDPVEQKEVWRYQHAGAWNGGTLSTSGNLVFQGNVIGELVAYSADKGERLWSFTTQTGITAGPVSFELNGEQYVSVAVGWGTLLGILGGPTVAPLQMQNRSRVLTFRLDGEHVLPPLPAKVVHQEPEVTGPPGSEALIRSGHAVYVERCLSCHGFSAVSGGLVPDLRLSNAAVHEQWDAIVLEGQRRPLGMPAFAGILSAEDSQAVRMYVIDRARALAESPRTPFTGM